MVARPLAVALVGPSGVGRFHARELVRAGARLAAVLASTPENGERAAATLAGSYGHEVQPCATLDEIAHCDVDAAIICSPPDHHLESIEAFLARERYVLCEKPLFPTDGVSPPEVGVICDGLADRAQGRLIVNTNNVFLAKAWLNRVGRPTGLREFEFRFYSNGPYQGLDIGTDLLPHALSVMGEIVPEATMTNLVTRVATHSFLCDFKYGDVACRFDLRVDPAGPRAFGFRLDDQWVDRRQEMTERDFRVFLEPAGAAAFQVEDPFRTSVQQFVEGARVGKRFDADFAASQRAMPLMTEIFSAAAEMK